jgi:hypothetical protein
MSLLTLLTYIAIAALALTLVIGLVWRKVVSWPVSFLQNFTGILFLVSGYVKAIDPLGTAYKMEQYFGEFSSTFKATKAAFLSPFFEWLTGMVVGFAVFMIVFEIVLGVMLIFGAQKKLTSWLFFLLVLFFTFLTGYTYLTGHVPESVNFFSFGKWGPFVETNMKVTDCGCFGDFIKLKPFTSFLKDVFLLFPAILFLFSTKKMHQLLTPNWRNGLIAASIMGFTLYCFNNYIWDIPAINFRPFKPGVNIPKRREMEQEAMQNVKILAFKLTNKKDGKVIEIPYEQYMKESSKYSGDDWEFDQVKSEPTIQPSKISDFAVTGPTGDDVTEEILGVKGYNFMIVAYDLHVNTQKGYIMVPDTSFTADTLVAKGRMSIVNKIDKVSKRRVSSDSYQWDEEYLKRWEKLNAMIADAAKADVKAYMITKPYDPALIDAFKAKAKVSYPVLRADDILLKTIIRSNPGVLLIKDGTILEDWHIKKLPDFAVIKAKYWTKK